MNDLIFLVNKKFFMIERLFQTSQEPCSKSYSICTFVTCLEEYARCVDTFIESGFDPSDCEYLFVDNSFGNKCSGFSGVNRFLLESKSKYVIFSHQDVRVNFDPRSELDRVLRSLQQAAPKWAVCGNAGIDVLTGQHAARIAQCDDAPVSIGELPVRTFGLDENFFIVKREANLAVHGHFDSFHFYATELCFIADILGWESYVIDFCVTHESRGNKDQQYFLSRKKWSRLRSLKQRTYVANSTSNLSVFSGHIALDFAFEKFFTSASSPIF